MTWIRRYHLRQFVRTSLLLVPLACLLAALLLAPVLRWLDHLLGLPGFGFSSEGARAVLGAFTGSMLTFIVFVLSSLLIVLQLAANQLSPRVIVQVLSSRPIKVILGIFTFAFVSTLATLSRVEASVPQLPVAVAVVSNLVCILLFFFFVQQVGSQMRPVAILHGVARETRSVVESLYPLPFNSAAPRTPRTTTLPPAPLQELEHTGPSGVVLAFGQVDIVRLAREADACVELVPQVGDFIARGDPLFRVVRPPARGCLGLAAVRGGRDGANPGARPPLRLPHFGRHRHPGPLARNQTTPQQPFRFWTSSTVSCSTWAGESWTRRMSATRKGPSASFSGPPIGTTSSCWRSERSASMGAEAFRSIADSGPCSIT